VLGACGGGSKPLGSPTLPASPTTAPKTTITTPRSTTTTSTPEYCFVDSVPPPKLLNTGTDYVAILWSLENYGNWLSAHRPDPARASEILAPGSRLHDLFARDLTGLRGAGQREIESDGVEPRTTVLDATADAASIRIVEDILSRRTVNANGTVTSQVRFAHPTTYLILLVRVGGHWFIAADDEQRPAEVHL